MAKVKKSRSFGLLNSRAAKVLSLLVFAVVATTLISTVDARVRRRIQIQIPTSGAVVSGIQAITAKDRREASLNLSAIHIRVNGVRVESSNECVFAAVYEPGVYNVCWDTTQLPDGEYQINLDLVRRNGRVISSPSIPVTIENDSIISLPNDVHAAYFQLADPERPNDVFVIGLDDLAQITQAREAIGTNLHPVGTIVAQPRMYNPDWSYHIDARSISFAEISTEVCDSYFRFVEDNLSIVGTDFLPNKQFCPWNARVVAEIDPF